VKAYWVQIGEKLAPVALHFGADDLVGTVMEETITHAAGATTEAGLTRAQMEALIRGAGREPFERDAHYERVVRDASGRVTRANRRDFESRESDDSSSVGGKRSGPAASVAGLDAAVASS
jgi:hypothetical protein